MSDDDDSDVLEPEYEAEEFILGGVQLSITTIAFLPIELLMENRSKDTEISGQKLWCGSLGVLQYVMNNAMQLLREKHTTILELGAGTGVLGMMCRKLGAAEVLLTDHDIRSLNHMRSDCALNQIDCCSVHAVDWYNPIIPESITAAPNSSDHGGKRLLIVAGDVLYKNVLLDPFFTTVLLLFDAAQRASREVQLLLCHVPRAGVEQMDVIRKAQYHGFQVESIAEAAWKEGDCFQYCESDDLARAQLYSLSRAS